MNKARAASEDLRQEAKKLLNDLFQIPDGFSNNTIDRFVDCVIMAAMLEVAAMQSEVWIEQEGRENER